MVRELEGSESMIRAKQKPRIAIVMFSGSSKGSGGTARRFARLFNHVQQHESPADVWLIALESMLDLLPDLAVEVDRDKKVILFPNPPAVSSAGPIAKLVAYFDYCKRFKALLHEHEFDVVHFLLPFLALIPYVLRRDPGVRRIFSMTAPHGSFTRAGFNAQCLYRLNIEACDAVDTLYQATESWFEIDGGKTFVSPCSFTDFDNFFPAPEKENWIVFAGRFEEEKNPMLFVDAVDRIAELLRSSGWKCFLLGDGVQAQDLASEIRRKGLDDLIIQKAVPNLADVVNRSKIFISIQVSENYPSQSLLESMAANNAVIATDVGETRRLVDAENGLLLGEASPAALAAAIEELTGNPELCERLGRESRQRAMDGHSLARYADYMEEVWVDVAESRRAPAGLTLRGLGRLLRWAARDWRADRAR
jgi:glycosyltransferase involved in cell wall biosynthesis